jgi:hypothetical protein
MNELSINKLFAGEVSLDTPVLKDGLSIGVYAYRASLDPERVVMLRFAGREQAGMRSVKGIEKGA